MRTPFFKLLSVALLISLNVLAQAPPGINYQGVARDAEGKPLSNASIAVRISILQGSETGTTEYSEVHQVTTNPFGLFMLVIGQGNVQNGNFQFISWAVGNKWLRIELDPNGGNSFQLMGAQQLMSVPYAFYAQYSGSGYTAGSGIQIVNGVISNTGDADNNATNELISELSFSNNTLRITDAGGTKEADLSALLGAGQNLQQVLAQGNDGGSQKLQNIGSPTAATDAATKGYVDAHTDADADATNEIQDLALNSHTLIISNNSSATPINLAPYLDNTDAQTLALSGNNLSITGGNEVSLAALNTDNQVLSTTFTDSNTRNLSISGGNSIALDVRDADASATNEIQDLTLAGNTLSLSGDATAVDLSPFLDNTDAQTLSTQSVDANTRSLSITGGNTLTVDVRDADASATNEIQDMTLTGNTLSLSGDATTVNLAPFLDNTDAQTLTYTDATKALSIAGGNTVTLTETQTLAQVLANGASAGNTRIQNVGTPTAATDATTKQYVDDADAALAARFSTTYAFKTSFSFTNSSGLVVSDQVIPFVTEEFDDFNVLATNQFTANEDGVYIFTIDGNHNPGASSALLSLRVNGTKIPIPIVQSFAPLGLRFNATFMHKLLAGQTVSLVGDGIQLTAQFSGNFYGYKL
ncbi:MAG: hypothetical protein ACOYXA_10890 [Bacteroidota bacterium]